MWDFYRLKKVDRDHTIVIARGGVEKWYKAGKAWLAPLSLKRDILLDEEDRMYAWSLFNETLGTDNWNNDPNDYPNLRFDIEVKDHAPRNLAFVIPKAIRDREWLPKAGGTVIIEIGNQELNIWTRSSYNTEYLRESLT